MERRRESASITSFRLTPPDDAPIAAAGPGQYLTVRLRPDPDAPPLVRSYSLSDLPGERGYRISVKREGAASRYLHEHTAVGDTIDVAAPRGTFTLRAGTRPVVLISAGVGATPVLAMLHALAVEPRPRPVWWLHGARDLEEHAFGHEVDALLARFPDAHRVVAYSRPGAVGTDVRPGRLRLSALDVPEDADFYLCGPEGFMREIGAALSARGVAPERVSTEAFGTVAIHASGLVKTGDRPPHPPDGPPGSGPAIAFARSHLTIPWDDRYRACSTSPRPATCPSASAAATASATTARAVCSTAASPTTPTRSRRRPTAGSSSAAAARPPSSPWTCR